jgi:cell division cycle 20-like protein 1 (cofactor of APC complex)
VGAISLFGPLLLTGSKDKKIFLRDIRQKMSIVKTFESHSQEICGLKWSPRGFYFASGGNDNKLCVFSPKTLHPIMRKKHKAAVKAIAWSDKRPSLLASGAGTADKTIKLWNINSKELIKEKETGSQVCNLAFTKFSNEIVSTHGFSNNEINIWNLKDFSKVKSLKGHTSRVLYLAMSPCSKYIVSGAGDETLRFWDLNYADTEEYSSCSNGIYDKFQYYQKKKSKTKKSYRIFKFDQKIIR